MYRGLSFMKLKQYAVFVPFTFEEPMSKNKERKPRVFATYKQRQKEFNTFINTLRGYGVSLSDIEHLRNSKMNGAQATPKEKTILDIAGELVNGERNKTYKHPNESFHNIANLWNGYFKAIGGRGNATQPSHDMEDTVSRINEFDFSMLMVLLKVARLATNNMHRDSLIDIAGYARCAERILTNT